MGKRKLCIMCYPTKDSMFNAGGKAPADTRQLLKENGARIIRCNYAFENRILRLLFIWWYPLKMFFQIPFGSTVVWQHPYDTELHPTVTAFNKILIKTLKRFKSVKTVLFLIDINSIRFGRRPLNEEIEELQLFDRVVAHSSQMRRLLADGGLTSEITVLGLLDYKADRLNESERVLSKRICFAGNLDKSEFFDGLKDLPGLEFNLYGLPEFKGEAGNIHYKGKFNGNDLSSIEGSWGLVWDGDSIDGCSGKMGEYMKINSPHKASLYTCAELPLIVPSWSAIAGEVTSFGFGITVNSLNELPDRLASVTEEEYALLLENTRKHAEILLHGKHTLNAVCD